MQSLNRGRGNHWYILAMACGYLLCSNASIVVIKLYRQNIAARLK